MAVGGSAMAGPAVVSGDMNGAAVSPEAAPDGAIVSTVPARVVSCGAAAIAGLGAPAAVHHPAPSSRINRLHRARKTAEGRRMGGRNIGISRLLRNDGISGSERRKGREKLRDRQPEARE